MPFIQRRGPIRAKPSGDNSASRTASILAVITGAGTDMSDSNKVLAVPPLGMRQEAGLRSDEPAIGTIESE